MNPFLTRKARTPTNTSPGASGTGDALRTTQTFSPTRKRPSSPYPNDLRCLEAQGYTSCEVPHPRNFLNHASAFPAVR